MKGKAFTEALFNAVIKGNMTQFCEVMKPQPSGLRNSVFEKSGIEDNHGNELKSRFYVGEIAYLKEPYMLLSDAPYVHNFPVYKYKGTWESSRWENKLFMPEKYARYFIKITGVKAEGLQDISDEDCLKEGIKYEYYATMPELCGYSNLVENDNYLSPKQAYAVLIDKLHGSGTWERNPYVFRYSFKFLK